MAGEAFAKHQLSTVQVSGQQQTFLLLGTLQEHTILNPWQGFGSPQDVMTLAA
jgi:hypothetical protein